MATKSFLKVSHQDCVAKVAGNAGTVTIGLATDLLYSAGQELDGSTQTVNITGVGWTGTNDCVISVIRNGTVVMTLPSTGSNYLDFDNSQLTPETTNNTHDISVSIAGTQGEIWLRLKKVGGYAPKTEMSSFGAYDNPTVVGS